MRPTVLSALSLIVSLSGLTLACSGKEMSRAVDDESATVATEAGDASPSGQADASPEPQPPTASSDDGSAPPPACSIPPGLVTFTTPADLEAALVGQWVRICGQPEVTGEVDGVEFAADHTFWPLRRDADGHLQRVVVPGPDAGPSQTESWTVSVGASGDLRIVDRWSGAPESQTFTYSAPQLTPDGKTMALLYAPWQDVYVRAEP